MAAAVTGHCVAIASPRSGRRLVTLALKFLVAAGVALLVARLFSDVDLGGVRDRVREGGWALVVILLPALLALGADSAGLAASLRAPFTAGLIRRVFPARITCDAICGALPGGVAFAEPVRALLLARAVKVPLSEAVAGTLTAKVNMAAAQALFLAAAGVFLFADAGPGSLVARVPAASRAAAPGVVLLGLICAFVALVYSGWSPRVIPRRWSRGREILERLQEISRGSRKKTSMSVALFTLGWVLAGLESFAILSLLGAPVSVADGLLLEGTASLLRIAFFFLPSALGAAEIGYAALIASFGVADPLTCSAAFIALKRFRELLWITGGLLLLAALRWKPRAAATTP
jgi:hypothetical protein